MLRRALLTLFALTALWLTPTAPAQAQDADDDGAGFLTRTLQNALSGSGRDVRITGFSGALSSRATLERMTIADDDGVWLELDQAELDWNRSALLRGRLEVESLSAEGITLYRLPESEPSAPSPEAPGFSVPDLPVSVEIRELRIGRFDMREAVMGQAAVLSLEGRAALAGGGLDTALQIERLDQPGEINLTAAFAPEDERLALDLRVDEPADGLLANLMALPGLPSVNLTVQGTGPLDDYTADLALDTDGERRMTGSASLVGRTDGGREFMLDLGGDLTALAAPEYREFLGTDIGIVATGLQESDGALDLQALRLRSAALNLQGELALSAEGSPQRFNLTGTMAAPDGAERLDLPFGEGISVASAELALQFDRDASEEVTGRIVALAPEAEGFSAETLALDISGALPEGDTGQVDLAFDATGLSASDAAVAEALGNEVTGSASVTFGGDAPVQLRDLVVQNRALSLRGDASFETTEDKQANLDLNAEAEVSDLSAFATLSGLDLGGQAQLQLGLAMTLPSGEMRLTADGGGSGLRTGIEPADALLSDPAELTLDVERNADGITLHALDIGTPAVRLTGGGQLGSDAGEITYELRLADAGLLTGSQAGPVTLGGAISQTPEGLTITGAGGGDDLTLGIEQVDALLAGGLTVDFGLYLPKEGAPDLQRARIETRELLLNANGSLDPQAMGLDFTARLENSGIFTGANAGPLAIDGQVRTEADGVIRAVASGGGDRIRTGIEAVDNLLQGRTDIAADVTVDGDLITLNEARVASPGITVAAGGTVTAGVLDIGLDVNLPNAAAPLGARSGPLALNATLTGSEGNYRIEADGNGQSIGIGAAEIDALLRGDSTLRAVVELTADGTTRIEEVSFRSLALSADASGRIDGDGPQLDYTARLDNLGRLVPELRGPLTVDGTLRPDPSGASALQIVADGPSGANGRVEGLVGMADGAVRLNISGTAPLGLANGFIAPRSVSGAANFNLTMDGAPGLPALSGRIGLNGARLVAPTLGQVINDISGSVSLGNGRATLDLSAQPSDGGRITASGPVTLSAPFNAGLRVALSDVVVTQGSFATTRLNGNLAVDGGLTGGGTVSGRIGLTDTEIRLANTGLGGQEAIPDITHVGEGQASRATRARAGLIQEDEGGSGGGSSGSDLNLDLRVSTDSSIFIRGRGLDAELRGALTLRGTTSNPVPVGRFELVRGRLDLLSKRLELDEASVRLAGGFTPILHFSASSQTSNFLITIAIDGTPENPEVTFRSSPDLPQDEIVAQLFFGRGIDSLSPLQAAQLAAAVATLTGSGDGGIMDRIRASTGLDDLDISTSEDGEASLRAGKYLSENIYTETEVTAGGQTNFSINLDVSDDVTVKGAASTSGNTSLGVFFERDY